MYSIRGVLREACRRTVAICRLTPRIRTGAGHSGRGRGRSSTIEVGQEALQSNLCTVCWCWCWCWCTLVLVLVLLCFAVRWRGAAGARVGTKVHVWIVITLVSLDLDGWLIATEPLCNALVPVAAVEGV